MLEISLLSLFITGLLGGVHCLGMCGGIVTAISVSGTGQKPLLQVGYNLGRLASYTLMGALLGGLSEWGMAQASYRPLQVGLFALANVLLVLLGLYLAGFSAMVGRIEKLGSPLWQHLQPLARRFLPVRHPWHSIMVGAIWGWVPCGLVYTASLAALATQSASGGALAMLSFGLGTLPNLLLMGAFAAKLQQLKQKRPVRLFAGLTVCAIGLWHLANLIIS
ncbi:sulfite exporter TauE/SafE family protein [Vogesella sp. DC21W]|uniref:Sulfite exporter TauE/SafE family protein n=1 Tax=Vogesella aquatica TaxID=2984206 RepID=A0ABT5IYI9_9NEIS|nr:sulfite exporter TauE/SafE family protein [Vogesella aquatica]MDC7717641.1 sulfite exporter TauE/SafE family protein [Vogesella aquatica]